LMKGHHVLRTSPVHSLLPGQPLPFQSSLHLALAIHDLSCLHAPRFHNPVKVQVKLRTSSHGGLDTQLSVILRSVLHGCD
jgi:hypothetical protein